MLGFTFLWEKLDEEAAFPWSHPRSVPGVLAESSQPFPHGKDTPAPVCVPRAPSPSLAPAASDPELPKTSCSHPWNWPECFRDNQLGHFCVCTGALSKFECLWCHRLTRRIGSAPHCSSHHTAHVEANVWHFQARVQSEFPCLSARRMMSF